MTRVLVEQILSLASARSNKPVEQTIRFASDHTMKNQRGFSPDRPNPAYIEFARGNAVPKDGSTSGVLP
jgi:hypothetical protein